MRSPKMYWLYLCMIPGICIHNFLQNQCGWDNLYQSDSKLSILNILVANVKKMFPDVIQLVQLAYICLVYNNFNCIINRLSNIFFSAFNQVTIINIVFVLYYRMWLWHWYPRCPIWFTIKTWLQWWNHYGVICSQMTPILCVFCHFIHYLVACPCSQLNLQVNCSLNY